MRSIRARVAKGFKCVAVNGSANWLRENNLTPKVHILLDARPSNARFVEQPDPKCRYLIASQCHPKVFERLKDCDVTLWHSGGDTVKDICERYYFGRYLTIGGGSTVATRALHLLYLLGFRKIAIYGMDSCWLNGEHHAYPQPENDRDKVIACRVGRRKFQCTAWQVSQANEFVQMQPRIPKDLELAIEGDGLIAYAFQRTAQTGKIPKIVAMEN